MRRVGVELPDGRLIVVDSWSIDGRSAQSDEDSFLVLLLGDVSVDQTGVSVDSETGRIIEGSLELDRDAMVATLGGLARLRLELGMVEESDE